MTKLKDNVFMIIALVSALGFFCSCAHNGSMDTSLADAEVWELTITGGTQGKCSMFLRPSKGTENFYNVEAEFSGRIHNEPWGPGKLNFNLHGKSRKKDFKADMSGFVLMLEGQAAGTNVSVTGYAEGSLSETEGLGTWSVNYKFGVSEGQWRAVKVK